MIDLTASQAQPSAEQACPFRETILMDADQGCRMVRHDSHPHLDDCAAMAFVGEVRCATAQQAGHDTFDHWSAVATGVGERHLARGSVLAASPSHSGAAGRPPGQETEGGA